MRRGHCYNSFSHLLLGVSSAFNTADPVTRQEAASGICFGLVSLGLSKIQWLMKMRPWLSCGGLSRPAQGGVTYQETRLPLQGLSHLAVQEAKETNGFGKTLSVQT